MLLIISSIASAVVNAAVQIGFANPKREINRAFTEVDITILQNNLDIAKMSNEKESMDAKSKVLGKEIAELLQQKKNLTE